MNAARKKRLAAAGWKVGSATEFLAPRRRSRYASAMPPITAKIESSLQKRIAQLEKQLKEADAWARRARTRIAALEGLVHEVKDHIDPSKQDIVLAVAQARKWVTRAVKILKAIF